MTAPDEILQDDAVIAVGVSAEDYMAQYAEAFCEWSDGEVIKMSPVSEDHDSVTQYLLMLLNAYFAHRPIGKLRQAPFVMRMGKYREPDLQIILNTNPNPLTPTYMDGPADICIEVVSPESARRDYGDKFVEYEAGGVREYWMIDPERRACRFHRLGENGLYTQCLPDDAGDYTTPLLPGLRLNVATLWQDPLPNFLQIGSMVQQMMASSAPLDDS